MENKIAFKCSFENSEIERCVESLGWMKSRCAVPVTVFSALVKTIYHFAVGIFTFLRDLIFFVGVSPALRWTAFTCARDLGEAWAYLTLWVPFYKDDDSYEKIAFSLLHKNYYTERYREVIFVNPSKENKSIIFEIDEGRNSVKNLVEACKLYLEQSKACIEELKKQNVKIEDIKDLENPFKSLEKHRDAYNEMTSILKFEVRRSSSQGIIKSKVSFNRFCDTLEKFGIISFDFHLNYIKLKNKYKTLNIDNSKFLEIKQETVNLFYEYKNDKASKCIASFSL